MLLALHRVDAWQEGVKLAAAWTDDPRIGLSDQHVADGNAPGALAPPAGRLDPREPVAALYRMAALVESSEDPIIGLTLDGLITDWNPAAERLYGYSAQEALGASIGMLVPPERRGGSGSLLATVRAGGVVRQVDTQRMAKDGRRIDVSISMSPIRDEAGRIIGAAAFTRDISLRIAAEERLRRSETQLAEAQELAALGSWEWDLDSDEIAWSPQFYRILGRDPDRSAPTREGYFDAIHPSDRRMADAAIEHTLASGTPFDFECGAVRLDGAERVFHARGRAVKDDAGMVVRLLGTVQDVTGLAHARRRLEQVNRQNEALLNSAADGIHGLDLEGRITFVNPAATALTGHTVEETLGRRHHDLVHHTREDGTPCPLEDCPCTGGLEQGVARTVCDEVFWRRDGASFPVEYTTTPISEGDTLTGALVVFRDITERRRIESELERLNEALVEQARRDPLTGLGNRLRLEEDLVTYDARRVRYGHAYCVLLCDLDHFKALNDRQGHQAGDDVLCAVADTLVRASRTSDAVYRYGGEELLVLLAEQTLDGALIVCERMREAVHALGLAHTDNEAGVVTISVGAAACPQGSHTDPADAITRADRALYVAKAQGRNRVVADR
jgi:diguanylate cyclase (GGDEF)-like protein/PAS domain S-box-containing protein